MQGLPDSDIDFSLKRLFVPLTTLKAIHWIVIIGVAVYANMLFNGFVWDDLGYIVSNNDIHSLNLPLLFSKNLFNSYGYYRPLSATYFAFLYSIFHQQTFFYHILQLTLHIINTTLLFLLFSKFFRKEISFLLSLLFLIHPIQVESVSFISASQSELFFLFGIMALLISTKEKIQKKNLIFISFLLLLSLLTKETGILFILMILFYQFLFKQKRFSHILIYTVLSLVIYLFIRFVLAGIFFQKLDLMPIGRLPLSERISNIPEIMYFYIKTFFYPAKLVIDQQWLVSSIDFYHYYLPLILDILFFLLLCIVGFALFRTNKKIFGVFLFFFLWFLLGVSMLLQIFPLDMTVADRWFYFPIVGLLGMIGAGSNLFRGIHNKRRIVGYSLIIFTIILLSVRTMIRNTNWYDNITLYSHDSKIQTNYDIESNFGTALQAQQHYNLAIDHYKKSLEMYSYEITMSNLAHTYEQSNKIPMAKLYYAKIISGQYGKATPEFHSRILEDAYERLGWLSMLSDSPNVSKEFIKNAINRYPNSGSLWADLAISEYKLHNKQAALTAASRAKALLPSDQTEDLYNKIKNDVLTK